MNMVIQNQQKQKKKDQNKIKEREENIMKINVLNGNQSGSIFHLMKIKCNLNIKEAIGNKENHNNGMKK